MRVHAVVNHASKNKTCTTTVVMKFQGKINVHETTAAMAFQQIK